LSAPDKDDATHTRNHGGLEDLNVVQAGEQEGTARGKMQEVAHEIGSETRLERPVHLLLSHENLGLQNFTHF